MVAKRCQLGVNCTLLEPVFLQLKRLNRFSTEVIPANGNGLLASTKGPLTVAGCTGYTEEIEGDLEECRVGMTTVSEPPSQGVVVQRVSLLGHGKVFLVAVEILL
jgi:hypothetical protein